jgi:hypothetical protein
LAFDVTNATFILKDGQHKRLSDCIPNGYIIGASAVASSVTGTTNETALATITVPGGLMGPNGILRVFTQWTTTSSANVKTLRLRVGGIAGTAYAAPSQTTVASVIVDFSLSNRNSNASQVGSIMANRGTDGLQTMAVNTSTIDMAADQTVVITGQLATGAETITLERYIAQIYSD